MSATGPRIAAFAPPAGIRARIVFPVEGEPRTVFWFKISPDGSVYFGPSYRPATESSYLRVRTKAGRTTFSPKDLVPVTGVQAISQSRTSLHPSGVIHMSGRRFYREPFRHLFAQERICTVLFERPGAYPRASKPGPRTSDIHILDALQAGLPLQAALFIAPKGKEVRIAVRDTPYQATLLFEYHGFLDGRDRSLQFVLYQSTQSHWPDATYLIIPAGRRRLTARLRRLVARLTTRCS